ncbi:hypothetical protein DFJ58DRAFT_774230 [Suillus subalutaceus]|uniref:uncharacterized protein n=1 Tax=Suillus subalutaceus TaxID=48586 RepID=UPI001B8688E1|nr:uncharacterized protein DFJ58DRAFT_774230 [Suillus subalutaceus]KAG1863635.1 hypothetical protein DFJ58DRAFT_774230 [Suillus subalutaceus]
MTEYTSSPEAVQVFRDSRERTEHWVRSHSPLHSQFYSPESPPSVVSDIDFDDCSSDNGSSHSLPPKMMLRYGDGRDVPISHWHYDNGGSHKGSSHSSSSHPHLQHSHQHRPHDRSRSAADACPARGPRHSEYAGYHHSSTRNAHRVVPEDLEPEEIQILPSDPHATPYDSRNEKYRPRRASEPYRPEPLQSPPHKNAVEIPATPLPRHAPSNHGTAAPPVTYSHSQPIPQQYEQHHPAHSHSRNRPPPSIVYAPGSHHATDHYAPPTIVYAPTKAPGMTYTVSAPTGSGFPQYPRITPAPYPTVHSRLASIHEEARYGMRGPLPREDRPRVSAPISEADSCGSGSTYYVIPTPGQKVKVLPGPAPSLYTATSTTKSPSSPQSSSTGFKKPFFSRLFSFASDLSKGSKTPKFSSKTKLRRRHSLDTSTGGHVRHRS